MKRYAWKATKLDLTTRNGFVWPVKGVVLADKPSGVPWTKGDPCPSFEGDGLCLALSPAGMAAGGYGLLSSILLLVEFDSKDVLGEDDDKVRVRKCKTLGVVDARSIFIHPGANLSGANLSGANLFGVDLSGAYLGGAYLGGAYLGGANLSGAYLSGAYLGGAYLSGAYLGGAYLGGAYLGGANLGGAYLGGANLGGANLSGAIGYMPCEP